MSAAGGAGGSVLRCSRRGRCTRGLSRGSSRGLIWARRGGGLGSSAIDGSLAPFRSDQSLEDDVFILFLWR